MREGLRAGKENHSAFTIRCDAGSRVTIAWQQYLPSLPGVGIVWAARSQSM